jgi:hypothetical protein
MILCVLQTFPAFFLQAGGSVMHIYGVTLCSLECEEVTRTAAKPVCSDLTFRFDGLQSHQ